MANTIIEFLSLTGLNQYDSKIKEFIESKVSAGVANSFKFVNLDNGVLKFYTVNPITEDTVPDFEVELPEQDLSHLMVLVKEATAGNVAVFGEGGQVVDTGIKAADLAVKSEVEAVDIKAGQNAEAIEALNKKVGELPDGTSAKDVIDYVNIKTAGIATDAALEELQNQLAGAQAAIDAIEEDYLKDADKQELAGNIATAQAKGEEALAKAEEVAADYLKKADKDELAADIKANADAIDVLNGEGEGSVKKAVDDAINKFATDVTNDEVVNSYKELIDWAAEHGAEAAEMVAAIEANELAISDLAKLVGVLPEGETSADIVAYIKKLVDAEAARAGEAEEGLAGRIEGLEGKFTGEDSVDAKFEAEVEARNEAIATAKAEAIAEAEAKDAVLEEAVKGYADGKDAEVLAAAKEDSANKVAEVNATIGEVAEGKTVVQMIAEATYDDAEVKADIAKNAEAAATAQSAADKAQEEVDALEQAHATDKQALEAKDTEIEGNVTALQEDVAALKEIQHVEITTEQINALFAEQA